MGNVLKAGIIGCGNISAAYMKHARTFDHLQIVACADAVRDRADARANEFQLKAMNVDELLADEGIDIVLNLTTPQSHTEIDLRTLEAGKHIYSEKPFGLDREGGRKVLELAAQKGLRVGCAPDTFLGGGHQCARKFVDDGLIGRVVNGTAFMMCHGHESWHPAPGFYYAKGGGPLFDMGPYYITALVNLLGPVKRVTALNNRSVEQRQGIKVNQGKTFPVEVDTHIAALLEFHSGAVITLITSFDVWQTSGFRDIELNGTQGALHIPDPNCFDGDLRFYLGNLSKDWSPADNGFNYNDNMRTIGLADMAAAIVRGRKHRCSGELACHVLDVMCSIVQASDEKRMIELASTCERPAPLPMGLRSGALDLD